MDGGIIDNQGIEGVKLAEARRCKASGGEPYIGTFLISDVSSAVMEPYQVPTLKYGGIKNLFTLRAINYLVVILSALIVLSLAFGGPSFWGVVAGTVALTLSALWFCLYFFVSGKIIDQVVKMFGSAQSPELLNHLNVLRKTPLYILIYLVRFRFTSVMKMVSDIFLRRIRALEFEELYGSDVWRYRIKSNNIYTLEKSLDQLPAEMQKVVSGANAMPTSLWFSEQEVKDNKLDKLIACGQLTMCSNLIRYIETLQKGGHKEKVWDHLDHTQKTDIQDLHNELCKDWCRFENDPYWLLKQNLPA